MDERNLRVLEFDKILNMLAERAVSEPGREAAKSLVPSGDCRTVELLLSQTEQANTVRAYAGQSPMMYFTDVTAHAHKAGAGGTLSPKALIDVAEMLRAARAVRQSLCARVEATPDLAALASQLTTNRQLEEEIFNAILSEDEISDRASGELYDIRRHIRLLNDKMRDKLNQMTKNPALAKYLQDTIITMRNGRYVVPVKAECRQYVEGLVHDQSASGATLYIEPMAVVEAGNDLKQWSAKEKAEIERILAELSSRLAPDSEGCEANVKILAELDVIFAKAQLGRDMKAVTPKISRNGGMRLSQARHPLIDPSKVVPISLNLGYDFRQLIITGPNTGGKTVTLKTAGLLSLMAQSGMQIPAAYPSEIAVFDEVFADIGDEQSIEQSLSTFSSHMTNIVKILARVTDKSLALFDELGAGTDPTEGAALAMSILERLLKMNVSVMATTHYAELKAFALSTAGVENASVEFDVKSLSPTYRLSIGVPGKSNAFEISRRLGLDASLIDDANRRLSKEQIKLEDVIANAEYHRQIAEKEHALAEEAHVETQRIRDEADRLKIELENRREEMMKKARADAKMLLTRAQRESESIISELKRAKTSGYKEHELLQARAKIQKAIDDSSEKLTVSAVGEIPSSVNIGDTVELANLNTRGVVLSLPDAKGEVVVQAGAMKTKAKLSQLRTCLQDKAKTKTKTHVAVSAKPVKLECDVRGMTLDEALMSVDLFLDSAVMQSLKTVSIIHGKGTGVLRGGVQDHLKHYPGVKEYRLGRYGEGEDGVTVVTLK